MKITITASREHEICAGHRVYGHESKCAHLHGHGYIFIFECQAPALDSLGRVIDFSVMKSTLCEWLESEWDHQFLIWEKDPISLVLKAHDPDGVTVVSFNPTAENLAHHMLHVIGPERLAGTEVELVAVTVRETRKCFARATK